VFEVSLSYKLTRYENNQSQLIPKKSNGHSLLQLTDGQMADRRRHKFHTKVMLPSEGIQNIQHYVLRQTYLGWVCGYIKRDPG